MAYIAIAFPYFPNAVIVSVYRSYLWESIVVWFFGQYRGLVPPVAAAAFLFFLYSRNGQVQPLVRNAVRYLGVGGR